MIHLHRKYTLLFSSFDDFQQYIKYEILIFFLLRLITVIFVKVTTEHTDVKSQYHENNPGYRDAQTHKFYIFQENWESTDEFISFFHFYYLSCCLSCFFLVHNVSFFNFLRLFLICYFLFIQYCLLS